MARKEREAREKTLARIDQMRGRGNRAEAMAAAAEAGITPEEAPFLDGYEAYLQSLRPADPPDAGEQT